MASKLYKCPNCNEYSTAQAWDEHTKEVGHYDNIMSVSASEEDLRLQEPEFFCPICNAEVEGLDIESKDE